MPINDNPTLKSPERAFTLQKYLLLHSQHDALQSHLAQMSRSAGTVPASPTSENFSEASSSASTTPEQEYAHLATPATRPRFQKRRSSLPYSFPGIQDAAAVMAQSISCPSQGGGTREMMEEEKKLVQVNQQIKTTLTELLNCESVRQDRLYSVWVQGRLMDAEMELKGARRHSVAAHRDDWEARRRSWDINANNAAARL